MSRAALAVLIGIAVISMSDLPGLKAQGNSGVALSNGGAGLPALAAVAERDGRIALGLQARKLAHRDDRDPDEDCECSTAHATAR